MGHWRVGFLLTGSGSGSSPPSVSRATTTGNRTSGGLLPVSLSDPVSPSHDLSLSLSRLLSLLGSLGVSQKREKKEKQKSSEKETEQEKERKEALRKKGEKRERKKNY